MRAVIGILMVAFGSAAFTWLVAPLIMPAPKPAVVACNFVGNAEVTDLIARLKPFASKPGGRWFDSGLDISFSANEVRVALETPSGSKVVSTAPTLREAVERIAAPSNALANALAGWAAAKR